MRLVDADAEVLKIEQEIHRIDGKIERTKELAEKEPYNSFHDFEYELEQLLINKQNCEEEINNLMGYKTVYDMNRSGGSGMGTFEQKIANAVNEKLNDGTVDMLVKKHVEEGMSEALEKMFSWNGEGRKLIDQKLKETIIPVIEKHDFNQYVIKLDAVLTEIVNTTVLADNKKILENFKDLMKDPEMKEIKLSDIFGKYCEYVAENVSTDNLKAHCDDGDPYYENVTARMEVEHKDKMKSDFDDCAVRFTCEEDADLNYQMHLYKRTDKKNWRIKEHGDPIDINSLSYISDFEVFLMVLKRGFTGIIMDEECDCDGDIEPKETPE